MPTLTTIDRLAAKKLHEEMNAAIRASTHLAAFAAKYGLVISPANASFDGSSFTLKIVARLPGVVSAQVVQLAAMVGFDASATSKDGKYRVANYGRGRKPWRLELADGTVGERFWTAEDRFMLANWPPAPAGAAPRALEVDNLIAGGARG